MKYILRQAALTASFFLCLYALALAVTFAVQPDPPRNGSIDVWSAGGTLYVTLPKYAFLGRDVLDIPDRKILLLGASNTGFGFRQPWMQALLPCAKVSNLSIGNSNITELRQMVDLIHDVQDGRARRSDTFVIGVWFGMFVDSAMNWPSADRQRGDTDLDIERYRYGFYRRTPHGPVAVLPPHWLREGVVLIRPYLLLEKWARDMTGGLRNKLFARPPELTDQDRERVVMSGKEKAEALAYWRRTMGADRTISQDQVRLLRQTIDGLLRSGEKVVLVDVPIPAWHRDASPYEPGYLKAMDATFAQFSGRPGFASLRMPDLSGDRDFSDEVHAKPHLGRIWSARLARVVGPLACPAHVADAPPSPVAHTDKVAAAPSTDPLSR